MVTKKIAEIGKSAALNAKTRVINFSRNVRGKTTAAIAAAFAFVIALTWNDAIKSSIDKLLAALNLTGADYLYKILTAVIITVICIIGIQLISKFSEK